jgi:hypothetical protein
LLLQACLSGRSGLIEKAILFTPLFTPARFFDPTGAQNFREVAAPQAQMNFASETCPLYPRKRTLDDATRLSTRGKKRLAPTEAALGCAADRLFTQPC